MRAYQYLARHAFSVIIFAALCCTIIVKFYHACRQHYLASYPGWVLSDIAFLLALESILAIICYAWPRRWVIRTAIISVVASFVLVGAWTVNLVSYHPAMELNPLASLSTHVD